MNIEQLNEAISLFQAKIESQGMVVNERDAEHLKHLIEVRAKAYGYKRYARQCSITKEGMNEGYCWYDGNFYTKHKGDTLKELHTAFDKEWDSKDWTDDEILEMAVGGEVLYWTTWEDESEHQYEEINGVLTEIK